MKDYIRTYKMTRKQFREWKKSHDLCSYKYDVYKSYDYKNRIIYTIYEIVEKN